MSKPPQIQNGLITKSIAVEFRPGFWVARLSDDTPVACEETIKQVCASTTRLGIERGSFALEKLPIETALEFGGIELEAAPEN